MSSFTKMKKRIAANMQRDIATINEKYSIKRSGLRLKNSDFADLLLRQNIELKELLTKKYGVNI